jgi:MFS family permease
MPASRLIGISILWIPLAFLFDGVTVLVLPVRIGGGATDLGMISSVGLAIGAGAQVLVGWLGDRLRDRIDRRRFAAIWTIPAIGGLWLLVGSTGVATAILAYVVIQVAAASIQASQQTLIPEHVDPGVRGRASGLKTAFDLAGATLAFLVLGSLLASGELTFAIATTGLVLVGATIVALVLVPSVARPLRPPRRGVAFRVPPGLASLVVARFLFLVATFAVGRFMLLLVAERLAIPTTEAADEAGLLLTLLTLAAAAAAMPIGWLADRRSRRELMQLGALVASFGIVALVPAAGIPGLLFGGLLMSFGTAAFVTANWAATTALVPGPDAGRLMGIANLGTAMAAATAGLIGPLIDFAGFPPALMVAAVVSAAAALPLGLSLADRTGRAVSPT